MSDLANVKFVILNEERVKNLRTVLANEAKLRRMETLQLRFSVTFLKVYVS